MNAGFDTRGKKFLRGYQTTDANGVAEFLTIYPGWYPGRAVHIHFKIRNDPASRRAQEFFAVYFDESIRIKFKAGPCTTAKDRAARPTTRISVSAAAKAADSNVDQG
jgi:protocatechuate 3,4-dioxygenase beta subunit